MRKTSAVVASIVFVIVTTVAIVAVPPGSGWVSIAPGLGGISAVLALAALERPRRTNRA